jgi:hypothetical protein
MTFSKTDNEIRTLFARNGSNTKALTLTSQKIWPKLKFWKSGSNFKVKAIRSKIMVTIERSCHKEHTYEI